jgi:large subunit ribosomal protein L3
MAIQGLIGKVIGGTQYFHEDGTADAVTAVRVGPCTVIQIKTLESDGYQSVQLGFEPVKKSNKPMQGHLKIAGGQLFRYMREVGVTDIDEVVLGDEINVNMFVVGDKVDVQGTSKGKGFQGTVKRYNFRGGPKTHGQSDRHRAPGSIGAGTTPGRVLKGMRMAGHMGNAKVTIRGIEVVTVDIDRNLLLLKGTVPGGRNSLIKIRKGM